MDPDQLNNVGYMLQSTVLSQDTTDLWEALRPSVELWGFQESERGDFIDPATAENNYTNYCCANYIASLAESKHHSDNRTSPLLSANKVSSSAGSKHHINAAQIQPHLDPKSYLIVKGPINVGRCTQRVLAWLQFSRIGIAAPSFRVTIRRRKNMNVTASQLNQSNTHYRATVGQRQSLNGSNATSFEPSDPTELSSVCLTYGRPDLFLSDECFIGDDFKIVLIIRRIYEGGPPKHLNTGATGSPVGRGGMLQAEPWDPTAHALERHSLFHKDKPRVSASLERFPVLDFTYKDIVDVKMLCHKAPNTGAVHRAAPVFVPKKAAEVERPGAGEDSARGRGFGKADFLNNTRVITAKAKGVEAAYRITDEVEDVPLYEPLEHMDQVRIKDSGSIEASVANIKTKYATECFRVCCNELQDSRDLLKVLRALVVNYYLTLQWIDLSCNHLTNVPEGMDILPLRMLYLHKNEIEDWDEVKKVAKLPNLHTVSLHGNPIAQKTPRYKQIALSILLQSPHRKVPLKSLDFVKLTPVDVQTTAMHLVVTKKDRQVPRLEPPKRNSTEIPPIPIPLGRLPTIVRGAKSVPGMNTTQPLHIPKAPVVRTARPPLLSLTDGYRRRQAARTARLTVVTEESNSSYP